MSNLVAPNCDRYRFLGAAPSTGPEGNASFATLVLILFPRPTPPTHRWQGNDRLGGVNDVFLPADVELPSTPRFVLDSRPRAWKGRHPPIGGESVVEAGNQQEDDDQTPKNDKADANYPICPWRLPCRKPSTERPEHTSVGLYYSSCELSPVRKNQDSCRKSDQAQYEWGQIQMHVVSVSLLTPASFRPRLSVPRT